MCWLQGHGPLHIAAEYGHEEVVRFLVGHGGAKVDLPTRRGQTALHYSSWKGYHAIVSLLLQAGATVNARNASGRTCLQASSSSSPPAS